jgi:signal peptidase I
MTQIRLSRAESPWLTVAMLAFSFILMTFVLSLPLLVRSFLFQPFNIPARSMVPTLLVGDYFFVSKFAYGYGRYTWPLWSLSSSERIWGSEPARGDVVVFFLPKDNTTVYVKRVAGLPGDRIQMKQGLLRINGVPVARERLPDFSGEDPCGSQGLTRTKRWREMLPDGISYETLDCVDNGFYDNTNIYTVPAGHFFVLGDNRDNSTDSRVLSSVGYVPFENLVGRVSWIYFSRDAGENGAAPHIRMERIGTVVR